MDQKAGMFSLHLWKAGLSSTPRIWLKQPLDPLGRELFTEFGKLKDHQIAHALSLYEEEVKERGLDNIFKPANEQRLWLANEEWSGLVRLLCASWQLEQEGNATLRVGMITDLFEGLGLTLSNPSTLVRHHTQRTPPTLELISESVGRNGLVFCLTAAGRQEALGYRDSAVLPSLPKQPERTS
ncbi:MAG: hypothetical protein V4599_08610 [Verrucomicrobiota bacterium]